MTTFRLERLAGVDLVFDGEMLANETTFNQDVRGPQLWQEVRIYRTTSDRWVVERTGKSSHPGHTDRPSITVCSTPAEVREAMTFEHEHKGRPRSYVTNICYDALSAAAEKDPRLDEALIEHV